MFLIIGSLVSVLGCGAGVEPKTRYDAVIYCREVYGGHISAGEVDNFESCLSILLSCGGDGDG